MMDSLNHRNADYIEDISMEIGSAFYPPPMILLPSIALPPLNQFKYDFKTEHQMIQKYKEDQLRTKQINTESKEREEAELKKRRGELVAASGQTTPSDSPCSSCSTPPSAEFSSSTQSSRSSSNVTEQNLARTPLSSILLATSLNPRSAQMDISHTKPSSHLKPSQPGKEIRKLHEFEEFEVAASVFDILELRSLDDRKELEKLLNGL